jgi:hypothetical protein
MTVASFGVYFSRTILPADDLPFDDEMLNVARDGTYLWWPSPHVTHESIFSPYGFYSYGDYHTVDRYHVYTIHGSESTEHRLLGVCRCDQGGRGCGSQYPETHELLPFCIMLWTEVCPEFVEGVLTTRKYFPDRAYYDGCTQSLDSILRRVCPNDCGN